MRTLYMFSSPKKFQKNGTTLNFNKKYMLLAPDLNITFEDNSKVHTCFFLFDHWSNILAKNKYQKWPKY